MKLNTITTLLTPTLISGSLIPALFITTSCAKETGELVCLGDSLTDLSNYDLYVAATLQLNGSVNYGICGSTVSSLGPSPFIYRYANMYKYPKIVIVDGGYNDAMYYDCPIGNPSDKDGNTFYGALNILLPGLQSIYQNSWIFYMTPFYYDDRVTSLEPYINAIVDRCQYYNMDCFNIFNNDFPFDFTKDTYDGLHVTQEYTINTWTPKICEYIQAHYPNRNI